MSIHEVKFFPSYDYREDPADERGACGMRMYFVLHDAATALSFEVLTDWMSAPLTEVFNWHRPRPWARADKPGRDFGSSVSSPIAGSVTLHSPVKFQDYWMGPNECDLLPGGKCYGDYGFLVGEEVLSALVTEGSEGLWRKMQEIHDAWMEGK